MIYITDTVAFDESEISERFVRAVGARGINLTKDATGVELRLDIPRSCLPKDVKERLTALGGRHVTTSGVLVVVGRANPSQIQNRASAHASLLALVARAATAPAKRKPTRLASAIRRKRVLAKERRSAVKRSRSRRDDDS